jgi:hypothetical protein
MSISRKANLFAVVTSLVALLLAPKLFATTISWTEVGDAGGTPNTAQTPIGSGALDMIIGNLSPATDTDVFRVYVPNPSLFSITMNGTALSGDHDTELYVLDATGKLVFNDDDGGPGFLSQMNAGALNGAPGGIYLIAYNLFSSVPTNSQLDPVIGWTVNPFQAQTGTVRLNLTGVEFAPTVTGSDVSSQAVPEPSSIVLLGIGVLGLMQKLRRSR